MRDFHFPGRSPVLACNGMCATSHPLAAAVALDVLKRGGNAVDAAIAGAVLLGFCEPHMTGLGGDCFALVSKPGMDVVALNGSGRAPSGHKAEALRADGHQTHPTGGALSVTIPGAVDAFCRLSADWGKLGLDVLLAPAIDYAVEGVPVAPRVAADWAREADGLTGRAQDIFLKDGAPFRQGDVFSAPGQAEVLHRLAKEGRAAFYEGEVAEDMVRSLRNAGGTHTLEDFSATACDYTTPIRGPYRSLDLVEHPPNGQGAAAILLAGILARFDLGALDPLGPHRVHLEAEATKLAYDARNRFIADPDNATRTDHLLDPKTADALAALIDPKRAMPDPAPLSESVHKDTVYITVVDRDGMAVSLIYSLFASFGSGLASDKFGILFHSRAAGFNLIPGHPNEAAPGKRPMHTIIPGMISQDGRVAASFGVMGGQYQATGHGRFVSNLVDYGMDVQAAIDAPRSFAYEGELRMEKGYPDATKAALGEMGHHVVVPDLPIGGAQAIWIEQNGNLIGASDPRKDGCAIGY